MKMITNKNTKEEVLKAAQNGYFDLYPSLITGMKEINQNYFSDKEFVSKLMDITKDSFHVLSNISDELKNDKDIILQGMKYNISAIQFASPKLQDDKELVMQAVKQLGYNLKFISDRLKDDPDIVIEAVKNDSYVLKYASERIKNNPDLIKEDSVIDTLLKDADAKVNHTIKDINNREKER